MWKEQAVNCLRTSRGCHEKMGRGRIGGGHQSCGWNVGSACVKAAQDFPMKHFRVLSMGLLDKLTQSFLVGCHQHKQDTQPCVLLCKPPDASVWALNQHFEAAVEWPRQDKLKLNPDNTEVMLMSGRLMLGKNWMRWLQMEWSWNRAGICRGV